ncbi:MAG: ABC transporter ATP-binding protein [Firmicutes bacterium]|nr:ABC transporter ATP-binding protein [Bacillota bacterium]
MNSKDNVLEIKDLKVDAHTVMGTAELLNIKHLEIKTGEIFGIIGESGAGKSLLALTILGLLPKNVYVKNGQILYKGEDLLKKSQEELSQRIRGKGITMIFQDPMASLNPVFTVYDQVSQVISRHNPGLSKKQLYDRVIEMLELVKLSDPENTMKKYPHELSGGMRQRVLISMALSAKADLLISDEATRALDVTIQAGILKLLEELAEKLGLSTLFISSNMALASTVCQRLGILYAGEVLEIGRVEEIIRNPRHVYTRSFLSSLPTVEKKGKPLPIIKGIYPDPLNKAKGCIFADRCPDYSAECSQNKPTYHEVIPGHFLACIKEEKHKPSSDNDMD